MGRQRNGSQASRITSRPVSRLRQQLAQAAARIMAEDHAIGHHVALEKAIRGLGGDLRKQDRPDPVEIDEQLRAYLELFQPQARRQWLRKQRLTALRAMEYFAAYSPRLTGAVLRGTSTANSPVVLHAFADSDDEIAMKLINLGIAYELSERRLIWPDGREDLCPVYAFEADGQAVEIVVLRPRDLANPPLSRVTGRVMERANLRAVAALDEAG